jgi:hypothetical protein
MNPHPLSSPVFTLNHLIYIGVGTDGRAGSPIDRIAFRLRWSKEKVDRLLAELKTANHIAIKPGDDPDLIGSQSSDTTPRSATCSSQQKHPDILQASKLTSRKAVQSECRKVKGEGPASVSS